MRSSRALTILQRVIILAAFGMVALVFSCADNECVTACDEDEECPERPPPQDLIRFLANAYEHKDIDCYGVVLSEFYEFEFSETGPDTIAPDGTRLTKAEDIESTRNMFNDPDVKGIEMHIDPYGTGAPWEVCYREVVREGATGQDTARFEGLCNRFKPDIKIFVEEPGEDPETFWVKDSVLDIMLIPDFDCPGDWIILAMTETVEESGGTCRSASCLDAVGGPLSSARITTWSAIKAMFKE